ncbi:MAG: 23S rRNA (pseudouridine(1915)-N(3))-methyltransferase RlmH [Erysipelotrichaceae bacterium]|nr:23S rRNA (pseudouridine(1915)-N(3))-methyltransferase RlmH [Erysipelotrichaceae bacterium]
MIKIVCVGKVKDQNLSCLINDYIKKINKYHKIEVVEVKDEPITQDEKIVLEKEANRVLEKINNDEYVILLDLHGKTIDSVSLSNKIDKLFISYPKITFVIGGSLGLADSLRKRANEAIKLSDLTFLHQMTRLILVEQIYRSFKILNHETYHK